MELGKTTDNLCSHRPVRKAEPWRPSLLHIRIQRQQMIGTDHVARSSIDITNRSQNKPETKLMQPRSRFDRCAHVLDQPLTHS